MISRLNRARNVTVCGHQFGTLFPSQTSREVASKCRAWNRKEDKTVIWALNGETGDRVSFFEEWSGILGRVRLRQITHENMHKKQIVTLWAFATSNTHCLRHVAEFNVMSVKNERHSGAICRLYSTGRNMIRRVQYKIALKRSQKSTKT